MLTSLSASSLDYGKLESLLRLFVSLITIFKLVKCSNGWQKTKGTDISYHRLPNGPLKSVWVRNIRRDNPRKSSHSLVCSVHLRPTVLNRLQNCVDTKKQGSWSLLQSQRCLVSLRIRALVANPVWTKFKFVKRRYANKFQFAMMLTCFNV